MTAVGISEPECGICFSGAGAMVDPRCLPCTHAHCFGCLTSDYDACGLVKCTICRQTFDVKLENLPSYASEGKSISCDVCCRNGINTPAISYCTTCANKYCTKHGESHDDIHAHHQKIGIEEFKKLDRKFQPVMCAKHTDVPYTIACRTCFSVNCAQCISGLSSCIDGGAHKLMSIDVLVAEISDEIEVMGVKLTDKEYLLSSLLKETKRIVSEFDAETAYMLQTLHNTRDEQLRAIEENYMKLEEEIVVQRKTGKLDLDRFLEEDLGVKWCNLSKCKQQLDAKLKHDHQVDMIRGYEEMMKDMKISLSSEVPTLTVNNSILKVKEPEREIELEFAPATYRSSGSKLVAAASNPTTLTLLKTVEISSHCYAVCHHQGDTYVAVNQAVAKIGKKHELVERYLINLKSYGEGITVYKNRVYTLMYTNFNHEVHVHDLSGKWISSWDHKDIEGNASLKFAILNDQVVIPDRRKGHLTVYSLKGKKIKKLPCKLLSKSNISMCAVDDQSVVISDFGSSQVFKVNISTGDVQWTSTQMPSPQGVTCYDSKVFVTNRSISTKVLILDVNTGEKLDIISDSAELPNSGIWDLCVYGNTLIVPRLHEKKVYFYRMN